MPYGLYTASPSIVGQAPDNKALMKSTTLVVAGQPLSTPSIAQEYFEPGINTKLNRRSRPKTNYELPSDMPKYQLGFVPTNKTPGANGEEPAEIRVKESVPADLMDVFARINAEEKALASLPKHGVDMGTLVVREYDDAKRMALLEKRVDSLMRDGYTEKEAVSAVETVRMEEAVKKAKEPPKPIPVQEAIQEALGVSTPKLIPTSKPIDVQMEIPYTAKMGRSFESPLMKKVKGISMSEAQEKKLKGRPTKEEAEAKRIERAIATKRNNIIAGNMAALENNE